MFTGLVKDIGIVRSVMKDGDWLIAIQTTFDLSQTYIGASIACSGICLTVVEKGGDWFKVQVSQETLSKTKIAAWREGTKINLEQSLKLGEELGGHFVFGHVDGLAAITDIRKEKDSHKLTMRAPDEFSRFLAPKGSVSVDGVSLTVNGVEAESFTVNIIPHTWSHTTLGLSQPGDQVHLEIDMLARYVARMMPRAAA